MSRPQQRMAPVLKWGRPAAVDAWGASPGTQGGSWAEFEAPQSCTAPSASAWTREVPCWTNLAGERRGEGGRGEGVKAD